MKKRLVSLVLATLLIFTSIPAISVHASAATTEDGFVYSISDGEVTITAYTGSAAELTVPAEIEGCPVTSIGDYAFNNCSSLTSIDLPDTVTSIGDWAFMVCSSLTEITLPDTVTSISEGAFLWCSSLTSITIPKGVKVISEFAFSTCKSLESITLPDTVTSIGDCAFQECTGIRIVYYEGSREQWNAISFGSSNDWLRYNEIKYLGEPKPEPLPEGFAYEIVDGEATVLYYIGNPVELTVPAEFEGYPVTRIGNSAFAHHEDLISIELPDTVTSIGESAFLRCFSLESINIPEGVTSIGDYAFLNCSSLENINIPDGVTSICKGAFSFCSSLTSITIPDGVTIIDERAFWCCENLESITIPDSVMSISEYVFSECYSLESITLPSVTSIDRRAFSWCYNLTSITVPDTLKSIGDYVFYECESLKTVYYGGREKEWNAISIGSNNESLTNAEIIFEADLGDKKNEVKFSAVGELSENGDTVTAKVYVDENPGTWCMRFNVNYNSEYFTFVSAENGEVYLDSETAGRNLGGYYLYYAENTDVYENNSETGLMLTLTFAVAEGIPHGEYSFNVDFPADAGSWFFDVDTLEGYNVSCDPQAVVTVGPASEPDTVLGDLNGDSEINAKDANFIKQIIAGESPADGEALTFADLNSDGEINAKDANILKRVIAGEIQI